MLKESLTALTLVAEEANQCRLFTIAKNMDEETRKVFVRALLNKNVSGRKLHQALRDEGITISRENINLQRQCMTSGSCNCGWDSIL
jgi:Trp operon repressor